MVTSTPNISLKLVHKPDIISTQVSPLFVRLLQNQSIDLLSVHTCKYIVKHFVDIVQPLKMNQFIQFLTNYTSTCLVLFCSINPVDGIIVSLDAEQWACEIFHSMPWSCYLFEALIFFNSFTFNQRTVAKLRARYLHSQLGFWTKMRIIITTIIAEEILYNTCTTFENY